MCNEVQEVFGPATYAYSSYWVSYILPLTIVFLLILINSINIFT